MPRYGKRKRVRKRTARRRIKRRVAYRAKRKYRSFRSMGVPASFPSNIKFAKLRYVEDIKLDTQAAGVISHYVYRCGSIYDPNYTGTGHQPYGYDTYATLFNHYTVVGAKMWVRNAPTSSTVNPVYIGTHLSPGVTPAYTTPSEFVEARKGTSKLFNMVNRSCTLTCKYSAKKFFNLRDVRDNVDRLGSPFGGNPVEDAFFIIWYTCQETTVAWRAQIVIDYIVLFSEPKDLAQS